MTSSWVRRVGALLASLAVMASFVAFEAGRADAATCTATQLVPQVRETMVNQGIPADDPLVRGKDAIGRVFLSLPSCSAGTADYIEITGATVQTTATQGNPLAATAWTTANGSTYPRIATYANAPVIGAESPGDPKFVIPGPALDAAASTGDGSFTVTFGFTINYSAHLGGAATGTPGTAAATKTVTVAAKSNNIRVLVVPMGDPFNLITPQFPAAATQTVQNGMLTASRLLPVRNGVGSLTTAGNGLRYTINSTMLNIGSKTTGGLGLLDSSGTFCGTDGNFPAIKAGLSQMLKTWNDNNPGNGADKVLGVVWQDISKGSVATSGACYDGLSSLPGQEGWARIVQDPTSGDGVSGGVVTHELTHTLGGSVAPGEVGGHSPTQNPDTGSRAYNVPGRTLVVDDRNTMRYQPTSTAWTNGTVFFEGADWDNLLCLLTPNGTGCTAPGTIGIGGAITHTAMIISGRAPATGSPGDAYSYVDTDADQVTPASPTGNVHVKQFKADGTPTATLADVRYDQTTVTPNENEGGTSTSSPAEIDLDLVVDLDPNAASIQVVKDGTTTPIYAATRTGAPIITAVRHRSETNLTNSTTDEHAPALSPDGSLAAWTNGASINLQPVAGGSVTTVVGTDPDIFVDTVTSKLSLAFVRDGDVYLADLSNAGVESNERAIYRKRDAVGFTNASASHPSADGTGRKVVVSIQGDLFVLDPYNALVTANKLVCSLDPLVPAIGCTQITTSGGNTWPSWSSADFIAYQHSDGVHRISSTGTGDALLAAGASTPTTAGNTVAYATPAGIVVNNAGVTEQATNASDDTAPSLAADAQTFVFDRTVSSQHDIFLSQVDSTKTTVSAIDDNPSLLRLFGLVSDAASGNQPTIVAKPPTRISGNTAEWDVTIQQGSIQAGSTISYYVSDSWTKSTFASGGSTGQANTPVGAILVPANNAHLLQYDGFPAAGTITYADGRVLADADHLWNVTCSGGFTRSATGRTMPDIQPPAGGLPVGPCTVTLTAHTPNGDVLVDTNTVTVDADADHDGIPASKDKTCNGGADADHDPSNADGDPDGDGIPTRSDPQPCVSANTVTVNFDPDTVQLSSTGVPITMYVTAPSGRDLRTVPLSSVRITQIGPYNTNMPAYSWQTLCATQGTAKFDRATFNNFFNTHPDLIGQKVTVVITGTGSTFTMRGFDPNAPLITN